MIELTQAEREYLEILMEPYYLDGPYPNCIGLVPTWREDAKEWFEEKEARCKNGPFPAPALPEELVSPIREKLRIAAAKYGKLREPDVDWDKLWQEVRKISDLVYVSERSPENENK